MRFWTFFLALLTLVGCAHRRGADLDVDDPPSRTRVGLQVDLRGWEAWITPPVVLRDQDLAGSSRELEASLQVQKIQWRLERCRIKGWNCGLVVNIFRVRHAGESHLDAETIKVALVSTTEVPDAWVHERLGGNPRMDSCAVVVRVVRRVD